MAFPVVKVRTSEFETFLRNSSDVATLWKPDNIEFERVVSGFPCTVDELMTAIGQFPAKNATLYTSSILI